MTNTAGIPGDRICSIIERVERIDEEIKALTRAQLGLSRCRRMALPVDLVAGAHA
jgi:hypothetical protein